MLFQKVFSTCSFGYKFIGQSSKRFKSNIGNTPDKDAKVNILGPRMCVPTDFERWLLVWMKKFKSKDEIPHQIRQELLYQTKSRARIRVANYMIVITAIGCFISVYTGKLSARKGDSIEKRITEWHENYKKEVKDSKAKS